VRRDFLDDPSAPVPNSWRPAVAAAFGLRPGHVVLQRRRDSGLWALPGGVVEFGESVSEAVVREVREETGFDVEPVYLVGAYSDPRHVIAYSNGEVRQEFALVVACTVVGGTLAASEESHEVREFSMEEALALPLSPSYGRRLRDYASGLRGLLR
jgi:8-oxo-dGTP pyrophosphatase MutT (NUDIX family)